MDTDNAKQIEDIEEALAEGRIDQVEYYKQMADLEGLEDDPDLEEEEEEEEEEQEAEEEPPVDEEELEEELEEEPPEEPIEDVAGEEQTSAREALMKDYPNSPELW